MWLWVPIFLSGLIKDRKFLLSFLFIFSISFFTLDHTRIFMILSIPVIIYLISQKRFIDSFSNIYDKKVMYFLGIFQLHKRGDGRIVDGRNFSEYEYFQKLINSLLELVSNFL